MTTPVEAWFDSILTVENVYGDACGSAAFRSGFEDAVLCNLRKQVGGQCDGTEQQEFSSVFVNVTECSVDYGASPSRSRSRSRRSLTHGAPTARVGFSVVMVGEVSAENYSSFFEEADKFVGAALAARGDLEDSVSSGSDFVDSLRDFLVARGYLTAEEAPSVTVDGDSAVFSVVVWSGFPPEYVFPVPSSYGSGSSSGSGGSASGSSSSNSSSSGNIMLLFTCLSLAWLNLIVFLFLFFSRFVS